MPTRKVSGTKQVLLIGESALLCLLWQESSLKELHKKENMLEMQKASHHSTPCRSFSLDKESGTVNRETSGNDKESNLENDILLQTILPVVVTQKGTLCFEILQFGMWFLPSRL